MQAKQLFTECCDTVQIIHICHTQKTQHECSSSLNLAILFTLLQKKVKQQTTTYLERTKEKYRRTNPYFKGAKIVKLYHYYATLKTLVGPYYPDKTGEKTENFITQRLLSAG